MKCASCHREIERGNGIWWTKGTCQATCWGRRLHSPHTPDLTDLRSVEDWLNA